MCFFVYGGRGGGGRGGSELYGPLFARCGLENVFISNIRVRLDGKRPIVISWVILHRLLASSIAIARERERISPLLALGTR